MYFSRHDSHAGTRSYLIQPNQSLSWPQTLRFFYISLVISLFIAIGFLMMGAWLILPFTGLEMLLLFAGLYWVSLRCNEYEVVTLSQDNIEIERFRGRRHQESIRLPRQWTRIEFEKQEQVWYCTKLKLCHRTRCVEVASRLNDEEKERLLGELREAI